MSTRTRESIKAQLFGESVIRGMTRLCREYDGVNLSQGFPDFPAPALIKEAACKAVMADFSVLSELNDLDFAHYLVKDKGVATVSGSSFLPPGVPDSGQVRFCFCKTEETLQAAAQRLRAL